MNPPILTDPIVLLAAAALAGCVVSLYHAMCADRANRRLAELVSRYELDAVRPPLRVVRPDDDDTPVLIPVPSCDHGEARKWSI